MIIRLFLVYGPGQDNNRFLPQIIQGCLSDKLFQTSAGEQLRDFCFIEDVSRGILMALTNNDVNGEVVNISSGNPVTIYEVIEKVQKKVGKGIPDFGKIPYRTGENMALYADISKAKRLMGWVPNVTLEEGLEKTVDDFQIRIN